MKKLFFILLLLVCVCNTAWSQTESPSGDIKTSTTIVDTIVSIFIPAILAQMLVLFADAKKWYSSGSWSWDVFWTSKIKPFLFTTCGGIILYLVLTFMPYTKPFIEIFSGSSIVELSSATLFGAAAAIIDGFLKKAK